MPSGSRPGRSRRTAGPPTPRKEGPDSRPPARCGLLPVATESGGGPSPRQPNARRIHAPPFNSSTLTEIIPDLEKSPRLGRAVGGAARFAQAVWGVGDALLRSKEEKSGHAGIFLGTSATLGRGERRDAPHRWSAG